jgi:hypothetical protein
VGRLESNSTDQPGKTPYQEKHALPSKESSHLPSTTLLTPGSGKWGSQQPEHLVHPSSRVTVQKIPPEPHEPIESTFSKPVLEVIHTDIGPLPSDLWQILNQPQPGNSGRPGESGKKHLKTAQTEISNAPPLQGSRAGDSQSKNRTQARNQLPEFSKTTLQKTPVLSATVTNPPMTSQTSQDTQRESNQPSPEIDLDELARRVFLDLKRKLAVEWERSRGRG